jgi:nucleolar protein 56
MLSFQDLRKQLIDLTKKQLGEAVTIDILLIQALASADELTISLNTLSKRLREWYGYILPELEHKISDHETISKLISTKTYDELLAEFAPKDTMGIKLEQDDLDAVIGLAKQLCLLYKEKEILLDYLESKLKEFMPNTHAMLGTTISARLLASAGSLKSLSRSASSTIQLYGAEKALFRHLKTGARSPKYGHIFSHQLIQSADRKSAGKVARALADKTSICVKLDYFKGEFLADKYLKQLQERFGK